MECCVCKTEHERDGKDKSSPRDPPDPQADAPTGASASYLPLFWRSSFCLCIWATTVSLSPLRRILHQRHPPYQQRYTHRLRHPNLHPSPTTCAASLSSLASSRLSLSPSSNVVQKLAHQAHRVCSHRTTRLHSTPLHITFTCSVMDAKVGSALFILRVFWLRGPRQRHRQGRVKGHWHMAAARMRILSKPTPRLRHTTSLLASDDDITSRFRAAHGNYINTSPPAPQLTS
jgi:hypothetical protein